VIRALSPQARGFVLGDIPDPNQDKLQPTHPLVCRADPAFPLPFSYKEVISKATISLPTKNILVTEDQGVKKKYKPFLRPQSV